VKPSSVRSEIRDLLFYVKFFPVSAVQQTSAQHCSPEQASARNPDYQEVLHYRQDNLISPAAIAQFPAVWLIASAALRVKSLLVARLHSRVATRSRAPERPGFGAEGMNTLMNVELVLLVVVPDIFRTNKGF